MAALFASGRRRLEEQEFVEKLSLQTQEQHEYIGTLQEAQRFYLEQMEALQKLNKNLQEHNKNLQEFNTNLQKDKQNLLQQMRLRDREVARMEQLQHEIWQNREWYRQQYEMVINAKRFRLFTVLHELRQGRQIGLQLRELLRLLLPSAWRESELSVW